jgi:PilZ domain
MDRKQNKRRFQRHHCSFPIELRPYGASYSLSGSATDLSVGGCYVNLASTLAVGIRVNAVLWIGDTKLSFAGTVRTAEASVGNGIEFTGITDEQRTHLQRYLDAIKAPAVGRFSGFVTPPS